MTSFAEFEHEGWKRVAEKYDSIWSTSTGQFIPPLLEAAEVAEKMSILDVGSGPGYVSAAAAERGALPTGLDFSPGDDRDRAENVSADSDSAKATASVR